MTSDPDDAPDDARAVAAMEARLRARPSWGPSRIGPCHDCGEAWVTCYGRRCVLCWDLYEWSDVNRRFCAAVHVGAVGRA